METPESSEALPSPRNPPSHESIAAELSPPAPAEESWEPQPALTLSLGMGLVDLCLPVGSAALPHRIKRARAAFMEELGFVLPQVLVRSDAQLPPQSYQILLRGELLAGGEVDPEGRLAISATGRIPDELKERQVPEPSFGMPSVWVKAGEREQAQSWCDVLVDPGSVLMTHFTQCVRTHAHEIFGYPELGLILRYMDQHQPLLSRALEESACRLPDLLAVFRSLLRSGLSVSDPVTILEVCAEHREGAGSSVLLEAVRQRLSRHIAQRYSDAEGTLHALVLTPELEAMLEEVHPGGVIRLNLEAARQLLRQIEEHQSRSLVEEAPLVVMLSSAGLRMRVEDFLYRYQFRLPIMSLRELLPGVRVKPVAKIRLQSLPPRQGNSLESSSAAESAKTQA